MLLVIGNKNYSSWSLRPWIAMKVFGFDFDEKKIPWYGERSKDAILQHSPAGKVPILVDGKATVWDSAAILEYLADKTGRFLPRSGAQRYAVLQWVHWQMANLGPMMGNAKHFKNYAKQLVDYPAQLAYGTRRFVGEVDRLCGVMDAQLSAQPYLAGAEYSIADVISWPWAFMMPLKNTIALSRPLSEVWPPLRYQKFIDGTCGISLTSYTIRMIGCVAGMSTIGNSPGGRTRASCLIHESQFAVPHESSDQRNPPLNR